MSFLLYIVGFVVFISGLAWLATAAGVSATYVNIGAMVLLAIGIATGMSATRGDRS